MLPLCWLVELVRYDVSGVYWVGGGIAGSFFMCKLVRNFIACNSDMWSHFWYCYVVFGPWILVNYAWDEQFVSEVVLGWWVSYLIANEVYVVKAIGKYEWLGSCICENNKKGIYLPTRCLGGQEYYATHRSSFRAIHAKTWYVALPCLFGGINEPSCVDTLLRVYIWRGVYVAKYIL